MISNYMDYTQPENVNVRIYLCHFLFLGEDQHYFGIYIYLSLGHLLQ